MPEMFRDQIILGGDGIRGLRARMKASKSQHKMFHGELYTPEIDSYGNRILHYVESNTGVVGGAILALQKLTGVTPSFMPPSLNDRYGVVATGTTANNPIIALFGCGIGGAGLDFGNVKDPDVKQADIAGGLVPMRHGTQITGDDAVKYFFRRTNVDGTYDWFLKEFEAGTTIKTLWKNAIDAEADGSEITNDISESENNDGLESFAEFNIALNSNDVREYFESQGNLSQARYNSFGFYTGEKVGGEYANVRLFSTVNFNNRDLSVKTTSSFVYRIYSLI